MNKNRPLVKDPLLTKKKTATDPTHVFFVVGGYKDFETACKNKQLKLLGTKLKTGLWTDYSGTNPYRYFVVKCMKPR